MLTRKTRTWLVAGTVTLVAGAFAVPAIAQDGERLAPQRFHETMMAELEEVTDEGTAAEVGDVLADLAADRRAERRAAPRGPDAQRPEPGERHQEMLDLLAAELDGEDLAAVEEVLESAHEGRVETRAAWRAERAEQRGEGAGARAGNGRGSGPRGFAGDCPFADES